MDNKAEEIQILLELFQQWSGETPVRHELLPESGSHRKYYRIESRNKKAIGVFGPDKKENAAFLSYSKHFKSAGLNVPEVYLVAEDQYHYLIEDLGNKNFLDYLNDLEVNKGTNDDDIDTLFEKVLEELINIQLVSPPDYTKAIPRADFDKQSIMWDLNYFKYMFLKLSGIPFDEQLLENDFNLLSVFLTEAPADYFLFRDFQSRNIMVRDNEFFFIDYQGGRRGALQYDLASFLFEPKTKLSPQQREHFLNFYIEELNKRINYPREDFIKYYYPFVFVRVLQAMGTYGFRGLIEQKTMFISRINIAQQNMLWLLNNTSIKEKFPYLGKILVDLCHKNFADAKSKNNKLLVSINSFSYKRGIPVDISGHGGGFVFDCRFLPNPGRFPAYKEATGKDQEVISYLTGKQEVNDFLSLTFNMIEMAVDNYIQRGHSNLMINFGCTGGQHRSVFFAEKLAAFLIEKKEVGINLMHLELDNIKPYVKKNMQNWQKDKKPR